MSAKSGVVTVTTAGTAVQGPSTMPGGYLIKADPANTGYIYFGNNGSDSVASTTGCKLAAGDMVYVETSSLNTFWFDSSVNGEKATWLRSIAGLTEL